MPVFVIAGHINVTFNTLSSACYRLTKLGLMTKCSTINSLPVCSQTMMLHSVTLKFTIKCRTVVRQKKTINHTPINVTVARE